MPPQARAIHATSLLTTASHDAEEEGDNHFQVDLLDTSLEGQGVCHVTFCGKPACAFNNVVNLRLLLGGSQFYLVERVSSTSPLANVVPRAGSSEAVEVGSDWFQLCRTEGLPDGCFWVKEGGEYWVAQGDIVMDDDVVDTTAPEPRKRQGTTTEASTVPVTGPSPSVRKEPTVLDMLRAEERGKASAVGKAADRQAATAVGKTRTRVTEVSSPAEVVLPVEEAAVAKVEKAGKRKQGQAEKKAARTSGPSAEKAADVDVDHTARAGSDPARTAEATASASFILVTGESEVSVSARRSQEASEGARQFAARAFLTPPVSPPGRAHLTPAEVEPVVLGDAAEEEVYEETVKKKDKKSKKDKKDKKDKKEKDRASDPDRTQDDKEEVESHEARAQREKEKKEKKDRKRRHRDETAEADEARQEAGRETAVNAAPEEREGPADVSTKDKSSKKDKKDKKDKKEKEKDRASDPDRTQDDKEEIESDEARAQRKKEKKEKKDRKRRHRDETAEADEARQEADRDADVDAVEKVSTPRQKHHRHEHEDDALPAAANAAPEEREAPADVSPKNQSSKKDKKDKKSRKSDNLERVPSPPAAASPAETTINQDVVQSLVRGQNSPALRPPPPASAPRESSPDHKPTSSHARPSAASASTSPAIHSRTPRGAARSPRHGLRPPSPEPEYDTVPGQMHSAARSPGLVLAPSPPLASPALGFTPVVNSLAEEFSLDNHSLSSFSTDSEYLYE